MKTYLVTLSHVTGYLMKVEAENAEEAEERVQAEIDRKGLPDDAAEMEAYEDAEILSVKEIKGEQLADKAISAVPLFDH
jgi:hypothetical protein